MIEIDGSYLEGGGQILRTSLSLAAITGKSFRIKNIRMNREKPGLATQHLEATKTLAILCDTECKAEKRDTFLEFIPKEISKKQEIQIGIPTAGSIALLLSTILPVAYSLKNQIKLQIKGGGTWNKFAPSVLYIKKVILPLLSKTGYTAELKIKRDGFFPLGGAEVELLLNPWKNRKPLFFEEHKINKVYIDSYSTNSLKSRRVAERQLESAVDVLKSLNCGIEKNIEYINAESSGSGILLSSLPTILGSDVPGEIGKPAEKIGKEAALNFLKEIEKKAAVDKYASDQLMIYLALVGGKIKTSEITNHAKTNAYTIEKFLDVKFNIKDNYIECQKL